MKDETRGFLTAAGVLGGVAALSYVVSRRKPGAEPGRGTMYGYVIDVETGAGIEGIRVSITGEDENYSAITDESGRYDIADIVPGLYSPTLFDPYFRYRSLVTIPVMIEIQADATVRRDFAMEPINGHWETPL